MDADNVHRPSYRRLRAAVRSRPLADNVLVEVAGNVVPTDAVVVEVVQDGEAVLVAQIVIRLWPASPGGVELGLSKLFFIKSYCQG